MTTSLLEARDIGKAFGAVKAVDGVSLSVAPGEIASVIGPNGAGKTTLFNALSGFSPADRGSVILDGRDITHLSPNRIARLGLVRTFQTARPLRTATVLENVLAGSYLHAKGGVLSALLPLGRVRTHERALVQDCVDTMTFVGLIDERDRYPEELSAGQLRLLEIARGLAANPRVLLLDEPAAGLNKIETTRLEATLHGIRERGIAVLLVEHDVDLVLRVSDHVTVLDFGRLLSQGVPAHIRNDPAVAAAYFGAPDEATGTQNEGASA